MHGGANGSGAPQGNQNALKHGTYTKAAFQRRKAIREFFQEIRKWLAKLKAPTG
jgi:glucans biosynthesis protein